MCPKYRPESRSQELFADGLNYLFDRRQEHILKCQLRPVLNQLYFNLKKKNREGKKKRRVFLTVCGYEALRWPLWASREKALFCACKELTV